jgi:vesicle coat complex subunit
MITDFKFNHETNDFNESIGVSEDFQDETIKKVNLMINRLYKEGDLAQSRILEELIATCSDEQIALLALSFIKAGINHAINEEKKKS